jgi:hypothetical protein
MSQVPIRRNRMSLLPQVHEQRVDLLVDHGDSSDYDIRRLRP